MAVVSGDSYQGLHNKKEKKGEKQPVLSASLKRKKKGKKKATAKEYLHAY